MTEFLWWVSFMMLVGIPWAVTYCVILDSVEQTLQRVTKARLGATRDD